MAQAAREAYAASRALRQLPAAIKRQLKVDVRQEVAEPLAGRIKAAPQGPYAAVISSTVKTKVDTVPRIAIGSARRAVSGGASVRELVYGTEFGGGKRITTVDRPARNAKGRNGRRASANTRRKVAAASGATRYRRKSTAQFATPHPFAFPTIRRERATMLEGFARIVDRVLDENWRS